MSTEDVRRVIREELDARERRSAGPSPATPSEPAVAREPETPEQQAATSRAGEILASALNRRQWTESDAAALRGHFFQMPVDDQTEVLRQFSMAVNQGRLTVETDQVPF